MKITHATRIALNIPFYAPRVRAAMHRAQSASERVYVYRVETDNGLVGWGDGELSVPVEGLIGKNPFTIMHDDRIGHGPQIALLDVAGKDAGVPVHSLIGTKLRDHCPLSWWAIDMPPADWAAEARESLKRGYTSFKGKARPWWDIVEQVCAVSKVVPADYKLDMDFNGFLLTPDNAEILLHQLDEQANVGIYESPFYLQNDVQGARLLCSRVRKPIVEHFHEAVLHARASDGLIIDQCLTLSLAQASLAASFNKPFWLQLPGSGLTTTFAAHLGSVLSHATLPYITGYQMWESDLLTERIPVVNGYMPVPDGPGLGVEVDEKAIEKYAVDERELTPRLVYRSKKRIVRVVRPGAGKEQRVRGFTDGTVCQNLFSTGSMPAFEPGTRLEVIEDDHSAAFKKRHEKILQQERPH